MSAAPGWRIRTTPFTAQCAETRQQRTVTQQTVACEDLDAQTRWDVADAVQAGSKWGVEIMSAIGMRGK